MSAGEFFTVLLRSDGKAIACGESDFDQCDFPVLEEGMSYTQVSAGHVHTVLLRSDGMAVACGANDFGKCEVPPLDPGLFYTQVSAGRLHTVLLRNDGQAVACGSESLGQRNLRCYWGGKQPSIRAVSAGRRSDARPIFDKI